MEEYKSTIKKKSKTNHKINIIGAVEQHVYS